MSHLWAWLAVAGFGALHGLNPATGWVFAAAWSLRSGERAQVLRSLLPLALGHAASIALVAAAVVAGLEMDRGVLQWVTGGVFVAFVALHLWRRTPHAARAPAGHAGLAVWSFLVSSAHGAGTMLVPALVPLCAQDAASGATTAPGALGLALAALGVHMAAMLAVTAAVALGVVRVLTARGHHFKTGEIT